MFMEYTRNESGEPVSKLPVELILTRSDHHLFLHQELATTKTDNGLSISVGTIIGSLRIYVSITQPNGSHHMYCSNIQPVFDAIINLSEEMNKIEKLPFPKQEG